MNDDALKSFCDLLEKNKIEYVVIEKFANKYELLVKPIYSKQIEKILKKDHYKKILHPYGNEYGYKLIYQMHNFLIYEKENVYFEISFELRCLSLMDKIWMPLEKTIQESIWTDKTKDEHNIYHMDHINYLIYVLTRSIFLKKKFTENDIAIIEEIFPFVQKKQLTDKLDVIFFSFANVLFESIKNREYDQIVSNYETYIEY